MYEVPALCHFTWLFQKQLGMKVLKPDDLELALLFPAAHPLMAELITKLCLLDNAQDRTRLKPGLYSITIRTSSSPSPFDTSFPPPPLLLIAGEAFPYPEACLALTEYVTRMWFPAPAAPLAPFAKKPPPRSVFAPAPPASAAAEASSETATTPASASSASSASSSSSDSSATSTSSSASSAAAAEAESESNGGGAAPPALKKRKSSFSAGRGKRSKAAKRKAGSDASANAADEKGKSEGKEGAEASTAAAEAAAAEEELMAGGVVADRFDVSQAFESNPFAAAPGTKLKLFHELTLAER